MTEGLPSNVLASLYGVGRWHGFAVGDGFFTNAGASPLTYLAPRTSSVVASSLERDYSRRFVFTPYRFFLVACWAWGGGCLGCRSSAWIRRGIGTVSSGVRWWRERRNPDGRYIRRRRLRVEDVIPVNLNHGYRLGRIILARWRYTRTVGSTAGGTNWIWGYPFND